MWRNHLKHKLGIGLFTIFMLGACAPAPAPTVSPEQIQQTAVFMAATMFSETQTAIPPTNTPTPTFVPTETPQPTDTPSPAPTLEATPTVAVTGDPCSGPISASPNLDGNFATFILIRNTTKAPITVSLSLGLTPFGQCGYASYVIPPNNSVAVDGELPYGCYSAFAFINDPKKPTTASGGPACITGPDKTTFTVSTDMIKITGP